MKDIEKRLEEMPLRSPSGGLDRGVETLLLDASNRSAHPLRHSIPLWQCIAACLLFAAIGFGAARLLTPVPPESQGTIRIVYVLQGGTSSGRSVFDYHPERAGFLMTPVEAEIRVAPPGERIL